MGKYKSLISNTFIFAIGTFGSKVISYLLLPYNTRYLSPAEIGLLAIITTTCNLILPIVYCSISEAIIRFGLDRDVRKSDVYTTGVFVVIAGFSLFLLCMPLFIVDYSFLPLESLKSSLRPYLHLVYFYVLASSFRTITSHFIRALGLVRLFALDGMTHTITTAVLNIIFVGVFKWGMVGILLATILADGLFALGGFLMLKLWRFIKPRKLNRDITQAMLRYSLPLVPTAIFWAVTNLSDRIFLSYMVDKTTVGLYDTANRVLPQLLILVSTLFIQAWQISAFTEYKSREGERFYSTVFKSYYTFIFVAASGMILLARPFMQLATASDYHEGWRYIPFLVLSVSLSCLVTFLGTIYNAAKHNGMATITTALGAGFNILFNFWLIPLYGAQGAAIATFASYFIVFLIRAIHTRKYMKLATQPLRIATNLLLLLSQTWLALSEVRFSLALQILVVMLIIAVNFKYLLFLLRHIMTSLYRRKFA